MRTSGAAVLCKADQRKMPEWRHGAALDESHAGRPRGPLRVAFEQELRSPAKLACGRLKPMLERAPQTSIGADPTDQEDLAARLEDASKFIECRFWIWHGGDDVLRRHDIERCVWKRKLLRIHIPQSLDIAQAEFFDSLVGLTQHRLGYIDSAN